MRSRDVEFARGYQQARAELESDVQRAISTYCGDVLQAGFNAGVQYAQTGQLPDITALIRSFTDVTVSIA